MESEERGNQQARPDASGGIHQQQEQKDGIRGVNQQAGEVVSRGVLVKQLIVKRVRHPGERVPIALLHGGEGPDGCVPVQTVTDVRILGDVAVIVIVDERVAIDRVVERQRCHHQQETQDYVALFGRREKSRWLFKRFSRGSRQQLDLTTEEMKDTGVLSPRHLFCHVTRSNFPVST